MILPQSAILIPPFLVVAIAGWLSHDKFPKWLNALISFMVIVLVALIWSVFSDRLVGNDLWTNIAIVIAISAALAAGPLAPLQQWLSQLWPSPLLALRALYMHFSGATQPMSPVPSRASLRSSQSSSITFPVYANGGNDDDDTNPPPAA